MADIPERKRLLDFLPPFMQTFKEIIAITGTEQIWMDQADINIAQIIDNAFIETCDEYGIRKYENLLKIKPDATDTLADRKARVLIRWNNEIPYTLRVLIQKLNTCCGVNNYELQGDLENYDLTVYTHLSLASAIEEVEKTVDRMMPMNMHFETFNDLVVNIGGNMYGGVVTDTSIIETTTSATGETVTVAKQAYQSGLVLSNKTIEII